MTYEEATRKAKEGCRVRHSKMGRGFYMVAHDGKEIIMSPNGTPTPFKIDAIDRAQKDWEIVT